MSNGRVSTTLEYTNFELLLSDFDTALKSLVEFRKKISHSLLLKRAKPAWWKRGHIEAQEDIKAGRVYTLDKISDLDKLAKKVLSQNGD